jgi:probable FeS assembly SUF system protein SufT
MSRRAEPVELSRDLWGTTIPMGDRTILVAGQEVLVVQALGGSVTVQTARGELVRIDGKDADAVGLEPVDLVTETPLAEPGGASQSASDGEFDMEDVTRALQQVYDPEIPVNVVDLGLIYRCEELVSPDGTRRISIDMSMTAPGCGMGDVLREDASQVVKAVPGVDDVDVTLVWDPPWGLERMSEEARLELGLL